MSNRIGRAAEPKLTVEATPDIISAEHHTIRTGTMSVGAFPSWCITNTEFGHETDNIDSIDNAYLATIAQNTVPPLELGYPGSEKLIEEDELALARRVIILVGLEKDDETNTLRRVPLGVMYKFRDTPYIVIMNNSSAMDDVLYEIVKQRFIGSCHDIDDKYKIFQSESEIENAKPEDIVFINQAINDTTSL